MNGTYYQTPVFVGDNNRDTNEKNVYNILLEREIHICSSAHNVIDEATEKEIIKKETRTKIC